MGDLWPVVPSDPRSTKFQGIREAQSSRALMMACRVEVGSTCSSPSPKPTSDFQERVDCTTLDSLKSQPGNWARAPGAHVGICWRGVACCSPLELPLLAPAISRLLSLHWTWSVGVTDSPASSRWASLHTAGRSWVSFVKEKEQFAEEPDFVFFRYEFWQPSLLWFSVRCHSLLYFLLVINEEWWRGQRRAWSVGSIITLIRVQNGSMEMAPRQPEPFSHCVDSFPSFFNPLFLICSCLSVTSK